jgi:hypothetical protein
MADQKKAIKKLRKSLAATIEQWSNDNCETDEWVDGFGSYVGHHTSELMADAAMAVLEGVKDIQDFLKEEDG